jgi:hypothetical protein
VVGDVHRLLVVAQLTEHRGQGGQDSGVEGGQALVVLPVPLADPRCLSEGTRGFLVAPQVAEAQAHVVEFPGEDDLEPGRVTSGLLSVPMGGLLEQNEGVDVATSLEQLGGSISHSARPPGEVVGRSYGPPIVTREPPTAGRHHAERPAAK